MTSGEETGDRLSRIEERLDRIETLVRGLGDGGRASDAGGNREPLDVEEAQERLDKLGERIDETRRNTLGQEASTEEGSETEDSTPEPDTEQAEEAGGGGPPASG